MAQFRGTLKGGRAEVSRLGHKTTGLTAEVNGWDIGCRVEITHENGEDVVRVYRTRGSAPDSETTLLRKFTADTKIFAKDLT